MEYFTKSYLLLVKAAEEGSRSWAIFDDLDDIGFFWPMILLEPSMENLI
jgi:hypothetical protein